MNYILDSDGYMYACSLDDETLIECDLGTCIEYTGDVPTGYDSLDEWHDDQISQCKLNAWKVQDGELVFDSDECDRLQDLYSVQHEENSTATHGWVRNQLGKENEVVIDEFSTKITGEKLVILEDSGNYNIPKVIVSGTDVTGVVNVLVSNKNLLGNKAVTTTLNGITFTINDDKSITINGTSTSDIEFILDGTLTNIDMIFLIKEDTDYIKSGLTENVSLNLYNYDGTDRTLIDSGGNGIINLLSSNIVTCSSLSIASGVTFNEVTINPQIEIGSESSEYIEHQENKASETLNRSKLTLKDVLNSYDSLSVVMIDRELNLEITYFTGKTTQTIETNIEVLEENIVSSVTDIKETLNDVGEAIETINSTMMEQTATAFEMLFTQTGIQETVNEVQELLDSNTTDLNKISQYIHFEGGVITLGRSDSQAKLILQNDRISFMTGENESAYISQNQLYITDSTILRKLQVGHWVTQEDDYGNLNTRWVSE